MFLSFSYISFLMSVVIILPSGSLGMSQHFQSRLQSNFYRHCDPEPIWHDFLKTAPPNLSSLPILLRDTS